MIMDLFFIVLLMMLVLVCAMSVGVIFANKPISGSCGGMSALGMDVACDICKGDPEKCDTEMDRVNADNEAGKLAYDASKSS
jgi:hypothetical protein